MSAVLGLLLVGPPVVAAELSPYTSLFDTGSRLDKPLVPESAARRAGWKALPEDELEHRFTGDLAAANDKLTLLLRQGAEVHEVYANQYPLSRVAAELRVLDAAGHQGRLDRLRIAENTPGCVAVDAEYLWEGVRGAVQWRLTTGQPIVEARPSQGVDRIEVLARPRYVVVPNFFGHDQVFPQATPWNARLPVENMFIQLAVPEAMVMCVWPADRRTVEPVREGAARAWAGCAIQCPAGKPLWVAVLQGKDLWHEAAVAPADFGRQRAISWQPPLEAKWRADHVDRMGLARSSYFGAESDSESSALEPACPCRLEGGRALVKIPVPSDGPPSEAARLLFYPMDRARATPLTAILPIDVLRNTLGVGPCQYILQAEGLGAESAATPDAVSQWVEREFARKRDRRSADEIRQRLDEMVAQVRQTQARLDHYAAAIGKIAALMPAAPSGSEPGAADPLRDTVERLRRTVAGPAPSPAFGERASRLAEQWADLIGKPDGLEKGRRLGAELRTLGAAQNRALADCRLLLRRLEALADAIGPSPAGKWVEPVRKEVRAILHKT